MNKENWEKRFDELIKGTEQNDHEDRLRFCSCMEGDLDDVFPKDIAVIKSFISTERARARSEAVDYVDEKMQMWASTQLDDESILRKLPSVLEQARTTDEEGDLSSK